MDTVIGIDISKTNLRIGYVDETGTIFGFEKKFIGAVVKEDIVSDLEQKIAAYIRQHDLQKSCRAVAIGVPSSVSKNKSFIYSTPNLPGLNNIDLSGILHEHLQLPVFKIGRAHV